jgi:hypothetical protein
LLAKNPYFAERSVQPKKKQDSWLYRLRFREQPDPMLVYERAV